MAMKVMLLSLGRKRVLIVTWGFNSAIQKVTLTHIERFEKHIMHMYMTTTFTNISEVNLYAIIYRLFHEDLSSIVVTKNSTSVIFVHKALHRALCHEWFQNTNELYDYNIQNNNDLNDITITSLKYLIMFARIIIIYFALYLHHLLAVMMSSSIRCSLDWISILHIFDHNKYTCTY